MRMKTYGWTARVIIISLLLIIGSVSHSYGVTSDGLMAYYPFNGNANDESGNGNNGTVNGATLITDRNGNANSAYKFDGNDYIEIAGSSNKHFQTGFTLSTWVKIDGYNSDKVIIAKHLYGYATGYGLAVYQSKFRFYVDGGSENGQNTDETYYDGSWHHVVGVYDGTNQYLYVDGVFKKSQIAAYENTNNSNIVIGASYNSSGSGITGYLNGSIDDIRIYSRALSESEIQELYQESSNAISLTLTPPPTTTVSKGGFIGPFSVSITNNTSSSYFIYVSPWLYTPDGNWISLGYIPITISANNTHSANILYLWVPPFAPTGTHYYWISLYDTSWTTLDYDYFSFTVSSSSSPKFDGNTHQDWKVSGWPGN